MKESESTGYINKYRAYDERELIEVKVGNDIEEIVNFPGSDCSVTMEV